MAMSSIKLSTVTGPTVSADSDKQYLKGYYVTSLMLQWLLRLNYMLWHMFKTEVDIHVQIFETVCLATLKNDENYGLC